MGQKEVIEIGVKGLTEVEKATKSTNSFKKELAEAKKAALEIGDPASIKRLAELQDKLDDVNDSAKSLRGSGVEGLKSSFGLLTDGFKNFDGGKISAAFKGIGSAMKAIPLLLIVEGVRYLIENFDELSKGNGILAKSLQFLKSVFDEVVKVVTDFTDAIGLSNSALDKQGEAIKTNAEKGKAALDSQTAAYDRQIAEAKAAGKSTVEVEQAKQQAIIDTNLLFAKQIEAFVRAGGELDEEKRKQLTANINAIKDANLSILKIETTENKRQQDSYKKHQDEIEKTRKEAEDKISANKIAGAQIDKDNKDLIKKDEEKEAKDKADRQTAIDQAEYDALVLHIQKKKNLILSEAEIQQAVLQGERTIADQKFAIANDLINGLASLNIKNKKAADGIFLVQKALAIAGIIVSTQREIAGIAAANAPLGVVGAPITAAQITLAKIRAGIGIATIAATTIAKFASGGGSSSDLGSSSGGSSSSGGGGSVPVLPPPNTNVPNITPNNNSQPTTTFTGNNNNGYQNINVHVKADVVETENRAATGRIDKLTDQSTFG